MPAPDLTDPYGIDVQIGSQGDLVVTTAGGLADTNGTANVGQALLLRFRCRAGELHMHPDYGTQLLDVAVGKSDPDLALAHARREAQGLLEADRRFLAVADVRLDVVDTPHAIALTIALTLSGGEQITAAGLPDVPYVDVDLAATLATDLEPLVGDASDLPLIDPAYIDPNDPDFGTSITLDALTGQA